MNIREHYIPKGVGMKNNRQELADKFNVTPQLVYKRTTGEDCFKRTETKGRRFKAVG